MKNKEERLKNSGVLVSQSQGLEDNIDTINNQWINNLWERGIIVSTWTVPKTFWRLL